MTLARMVVGCMTGTSIDAIDVSLVKITGRALDIHATHVRSASRALGPLERPLRDLAEQRPMTAGQIASIARDFSLLHAQVVEEVCAGIRPDLISVHGQTVFHNPPVSWQLFQPAPLARHMQSPVVCDIRAADLAAGGQGAPLTPIADWILLRERREPVAVINLGGFCNITRVTPRIEDVVAADVCPCNLLLDAVARQLLNRPFDEDGRIALSAQPDPVATEKLAARFSRAQSPRSLGTGDEAFAWIAESYAGLAPNVVAASACAAIGRTIAGAVEGSACLLVAGGGARNAALMRELTSSAGCPVEPFDVCSVPATARESVEWAILGALCEDGVPVSLPSVTGCTNPAPIAGLWAFPSGPRTPPE